jgi:hypothetical protein
VGAGMISSRVQGPRCSPLCRREVCPSEVISTESVLTKWTMRRAVAGTGVEAAKAVAVSQQRLMTKANRYLTERRDGMLSMVPERKRSYTILCVRIIESSGLEMWQPRC